MVKEKKIGKFSGIISLVLLEVFLFFIILSAFGNFVGGLSGGNVTVQTTLRVGNVSPEILNLTVDNYQNVTLTANDTTNVSCQGLLRDWNGDGNITNVTAEFFMPGSGGTYGGPNDNNYHYVNNSCLINYSFGSWNGMTDTQYLALATCNFSVLYYADPGTWNCTMFVDTLSGLNTTGTNTTTVNQLLAVGLPDSIDYGLVNATYVSDENDTNVTNMGNTLINLSLYGYGANPGDGTAMMCQVGAGPSPNISIDYEKYNLTVAHPVGVSLTQFETNYTNLTSGYVVKDFNLNYRQNDAQQGTDDTNATYWRIYVPNGVAGNCSGYVVFGAAVAPGS